MAAVDAVVTGGTEHPPILNPLGMIRKWISGYSLMRAELICVESGFRVLGSILGSTFWVRFQFLFTGSGSKCRVRNMAIAPNEPATNLELGSREPRTLEPRGTWNEQGTRNPTWNPEPGTGTGPNQTKYRVTDVR
jgi:hypothetical protein